MAALNRVILIGNLTQDPELRYTPSGVAVTSFTLAVNRRGSNSGSDDQPDADFIPIVVWRTSAERCSEYLEKGSQIAVDGRLQVRSYDDRDGIRRTRAEVVAWRVVFLQRLKQRFSQDTGEQGEDNEISRVPLNEEEVRDYDPGYGGQT